MSLEINQEEIKLLREDVSTSLMLALGGYYPILIALEKIKEGGDEDFEKIKELARARVLDLSSSLVLIKEINEDDLSILVPLLEALIVPYSIFALLESREEIHDPLFFESGDFVDLITEEVVSFLDDNSEKGSAYISGLFDKE